MDMDIQNVFEKAKLISFQNGCESQHAVSELWPFIEILI